MNPYAIRHEAVLTASCLRRGILLTMTVAALCIGTERLAYAATLIVNSTVDAADVGSSHCLRSAGQCTLRAAIMEANVLPGHDTIIVPAGTYLLTISGDSEDKGATGDLDITSDLTIEGHGAGATIIQGEQNFNDRIMHVHSATVEIRGVTLRNGKVTGNGGGLRNQKGTVTLTDCAVVGNRATMSGKLEAELRAAEVEKLDPIMITSGGGIFNTGTLRLIRCSVNDNIAAAFGGGIASDTPEARVILENFIVSNNKTVRGSGGGIFINRAALEATNGRIVKNRAGEPGSPEFFAPSTDAGGIGTDKRRSRASLMNVILSENSALEDGGAIENEAGTMELTNCVVSDNWTEGREVSPGVIDGQGGGIENDRGTMKIRNSRIVNNRSATVGGGIHNANGTLTVTESTVSGNWAETSGGGIYNRENPFLDVETGQLVPSTTSELTIINSTFSDNTAWRVNGGGIFNASAATATVSNSTLASNRNAILTQLFVLGGGSAIANFGTMTVSHSTVALNAPGGRGGGVIANAGELTMSNTILANNPYANCSLFTSLESAGYNLSSDSTCRDFSQTGDQNGVPADLDPAGLQDNGGPTNTIALLPSSLAVDKGKAFGMGEAQDQRGAARFNFATIPDAMGGDGSDIGAFELQMIDGTLPVAGGTISDTIFGTMATLTVPPGVLSAPTTVTIDVLDLDIPVPTGFSAPGTRFVNIQLQPVPAFPLGPPGLTVVLPLVNPLTPGTRLALFRVDSATGNLVRSLDVAGHSVVGIVDPGGLSATFTGIAHLSTIVGLVPSIPGDLDDDGQVDCRDLGIVRDSFGKRSGQPGFDPRADTNNDGVVNVKDLAFVAQKLPAGMQCP